MPDIFDQLAAKQQAPPTVPQAATPAASPSPQTATPQGGDIFDRLAGQQTPQPLSANPNGEGTYQLSKGSETIGVPYSKVSQALASGYAFANIEEDERFRKDRAYDPNPHKQPSPFVGEGGGVDHPVLSVASGVAKGALQTASGAAHLVGAHSQKLDELANTRSSDALESAGEGLEGIAEFFLGDEALKGLSLSDKLGLAQKVSSLAEKSPIVAKILHLGMDAVRQGAVGAAQGTVKSDADTPGGQLDAGLKEGVTAAGTAAVVGGVGEALKSMRPGTVDIPYTSTELKTGVLPTDPDRAVPILENKTIGVPVRSTGPLANAGEWIADKSALQKFDVEQTQSKARDVLSALADEAKNSTMIDLQSKLNVGNNSNRVDLMNAYEHLKTEFPDGQSRQFLDKWHRQMQLNLDDMSGEAENELSDALTGKSGNFREYAADLKDRLRYLYELADGESALDDGTRPFREAQDNAAKAKADHDSAAYDKAINAQRKLFDSVHGQGAYDKVRGLYSKVDAIGKIGAKFDSLSVIKPTPAHLLPLATRGGTMTDPGMIDGAALRRAILDLSRDTETVDGNPASVFDRAGISQATVNKLQELGRILELSSPNRVKAKIADTIASSHMAGIEGGVIGALPFALSHALSGGTVTAGIAAGYGANKMLGYLMTNPKALDYALRAAKTLAPAAAAQVARDKKSDGN